MGVSYKRRAPAAGMKETATLSFSLSKYTHDAFSTLAFFSQPNRRNDHRLFVYSASLV
jgi:hypothetical protein